MVPRLATATTGPNDDMSAAVASTAASTPIAPRIARCDAVASIAMPNASTKAPTTAIHSAVAPFNRSSARACTRMRSASSRERSSARPNCSVSDRPRRLSSTKAFMPPMRSRTARPDAPVALDDTIGTATPTAR